MNQEFPDLTTTRLDATNFPAWRDRILAFEADPATIESRTYPGYPNWPLPRVTPRNWPPLDKSLLRRRTTSILSTTMPHKRDLSRLLNFAHGVHADRARGPVPSAGGLQALELYLVTFEPSWLPDGVYHFDREKNFLSQIVRSASRQEWTTRVPSLHPITGGAFLMVLVGDYARISEKYGARGLRFLLLEAGHLAQNLCLLASSLNFCALPLGGFCEREIARRLTLPSSDEVLYVMLCGQPKKDHRPAVAI